MRKRKRESKEAREIDKMLWKQIVEKAKEITKALRDFKTENEKKPG